MFDDYGFSGETLGKIALAVTGVAALGGEAGGQFGDGRRGVSPRQGAEADGGFPVISRSLES